MSELPLAKRLAAANGPALQEMLREAEVHLASQQTVAIAADQRAMTFTGFLAAAAVVLVGGGASFALAAEPNIALARVCLAVAAALMVSMLLAVWAAAPARFDFAGNSPEDWVADIEAGVTLEASLAEVCANHAESITANHDRMRKNGNRLWAAILVALLAFLIGGIAFVVELPIWG